MFTGRSVQSIQTGSGIHPHPILTKLYMIVVLIVVVVVIMVIMIIIMIITIIIIIITEKYKS